MKPQTEAKPKQGTQPLNEEPAKLDDLILNVAAPKPKAENITRSPSQLPEQIQDMLKNGIPVRKAVFHKSLIFHNKNSLAETCYVDKEFDKSAKVNKHVKMWLTPYVLVIEQGGEYKLVPLANVSDITV
jgi:hypothetical protein